MSIPDTLRLLLQLSGHTQTKLASELGVSFVSLNNWIHGKATPSPASRRKIEVLYASLTGLRESQADPLRVKRKILLARATRARSVLRTILTVSDIHDEFVLRLTFTSNQIEGSTLTERETAIVLFQNATLPHKTLTEQLEAKNHQAAFECLLTHLGSRKSINEQLALKLHAILMNGIRDDAGVYRRHGVRLLGSHVPTANHLKVPALMTALLADAKRRTADALGHAARIHSRFEQIHPFSDGNGRVGRLLLNAMLLKANFPPAIIRQDKKRFYYSSLQRAQLQGDLLPLEEFLADAVLEGWNIINRTV